MPLTELNHYFVRANDVKKTRDFYCKALDLEEMPRPDFPFPGYWLGREGKIWVHMGQHGVPNAPLYYRGTPADAATANSGVIDHIAFVATDPEAFRQRFEDMQCDYWARSLPQFDLFQVFVRDPDGLTIELNFMGLKDIPNWGGENYAEMPRVSEADAAAAAAR